jgi:hypothetical protein
MQLQQATRKRQKIRLALQGDTHSGKTYSALLFAYGLISDWSKIAVIDTEEKSALLYAHLGPFNTIEIGAPFTANKYCDAIELCENAQMEVIIIDSISPEWVGEQGILDIYSSIDGDKSAKYNAVMPNHHAFMSYILESSCHVIATVRSIERRIQQQKGYAHHFTTVLELDREHRASVIKDRTSVFQGLSAVVLNESIGAKIREWCDDGVERMPEALQKKIDACKSQKELVKLMVDSDIEDVTLISAFTKKRLELDGLGNGIMANGKLIPIS